MSQFKFLVMTEKNIIHLPLNIDILSSPPRPLSENLVGGSTEGEQESQKKNG